MLSMLALYDPEFCELLQTFCHGPILLVLFHSQEWRLEKLNRYDTFVHIAI